MSAMLSAAQMQKIWLLSDTVLYTEAVAFMRKLVREQDCYPLPASQVAGLLNMAGSAKYDELRRFVVHQRDRDWPPSKRDIKTFYSALEETLSLMQRKRLKDEFHLLTSEQGRAVNEMRQEVDELMAEVAREFIQHLAAENGLLAAEEADKRMKQQPSRR
jgi:hypothetical protein